MQEDKPIHICRFSEIALISLPSVPMTHCPQECSNSKHKVISQIIQCPVCPVKLADNATTWHHCILAPRKLCHTVLSYVQLLSSH